MGRIVRTGMAAVLNANDIDTRRAAPILQRHVPDPSSIPLSCPDPLARALARRATGGRRMDGYPAPAALQGAVVAIVLHDTRGIALSAQRLSHFPATPLVCVSWYRDLDVGFVENTADGRWRPFGAAVTLSGSHSAPTVARRRRADGSA